ncbi:MAG: hypothetical protein M1820_009159 [Bogoriella megaspora]|nr:MAG: hypothetical protein M1820_009159 [Bogoriella megaspora]
MSKEGFPPSAPGMQQRDYTEACLQSDAPPPYSEDLSDLPEAENKEIEDHLQWIPKPPSRQFNYRPLRRPVAMPQVGIGRRIAPPMPFLRAWSPDLAAHDINQQDFVAFIDNLAVAMMAPAPFQILDMGSMVAGFIPNSIAQFVSGGVGLASGIGSAAFIIVRTKKYLARVNEEFFNPRGLVVLMKTDGELCQDLGLSGEKMQQVNVATVDTATSDMTPLPERRLRALQPYIANLTLDVPPLTKQKGMFDKIAAKQQEMKIAKNQRKSQKRAVKQTEKAEKRIIKDEKRRRRRDSPGGDQGSQLGCNGNLHILEDDGLYSDTSSIASIEHGIMELDLDAQQISTRVSQGAESSEGIDKMDRKLAKLSEERTKLLQRLEKKVSKHSARKKPEHIGWQDAFREQPAYRGQLKGVRNESYRREQPADVLQSNRKQQEKDLSELERLRWIVVQNR